MSQNPDTKHYIVVLRGEDYCENCGGKYSNTENKWCKRCTLDNMYNLH